LDRGRRRLRLADRSGRNSKEQEQAKPGKRIFGESVPE
jgi:hypothetical protein